MKIKLSLLIFVVILNAIQIRAQAPNWIWATGDGGSKNDIGTSIVTDNSGNSYVTGYFDSVATFGNTVLTSNGSYDIFIAKYDSSGNLIWAQSAGGSSFWDQGHGIALDKKGNLYVTGFFIDTATFGSVSLISNGYFDCFLAKYDTSGNVIWAQKAGGIGWDEGNDLSFDSLGNCYVTGRFLDSATFGNITITGITDGYMDVFVAKYDTSGNVIWVQAAQGIDAPSIGQGIATDVNGNSYITGWFADTVIFGSFVLASTNSGYDETFIAKYDSSGNVIWAHQAHQAWSGFFNWGLDISIDANGNCYVAGIFYGKVAFGNDTVTSAGAADIFLAKYDLMGNVNWVQRAGGTQMDFCYGITSDDSGNFYITGYFNDTATFDTLNVIGIWEAYVAKYNTFGNAIWVQQSGGAGAGYRTSLDGNGNCYVDGYFGLSANFGTNNILTNGGDDFFIAKLGTNGTTSVPLIVSSEEEIQIVPNPFKDKINITTSSSELAEIIIYDITSRKLLQQKFTNTVTLNTAQLAKGMYVYEVRNGKGVVKKGKVVRE